jgi:hypothetical protein
MTNFISIEQLFFLYDDGEKIFFWYFELIFHETLIAVLVKENNNLIAGSSIPNLKVLVDHI